MHATRQNAFTMLAFTGYECFLLSAADDVVALRCGLRVQISNSSFAVVASTSSATIPLQPGVPQRAHADVGKYQYFSVQIDSYNQALLIMVPLRLPYSCPVLHRV